MVNQCVVCGRNHPLKYCFKFRRMFFRERYEVVLSSGLCLNCFHTSHKRSDCPSPNRCEVCGNRHHSMIHNRDDIFFEPEAPTKTLRFGAVREIAEKCGLLSLCDISKFDPADLDDSDDNDAPLATKADDTTELIESAQDSASLAAQSISGFLKIESARTSAHLAEPQQNRRSLAEKVENEDPIAPKPKAAPSVSTRVKTPERPPYPDSYARWAVTDPKIRHPEHFGACYVAPVVLCDLCVGKKIKSVTLLINPNVPKSHLLYDKVSCLPYVTKFQKNTANGHFKVRTRIGEVLDHWFIIVDKLQKYPPPARDVNITTWISDKSTLAHPTPHLYKPIAGVIGNDLWATIQRGPPRCFYRCPSMTAQESSFGITLKGNFFRYIGPGPEPVFL
ncbi:uncharacterized protein LOC142221374 [Haematobia irritans]|uniref:uncharacterized protein LOC142221374 n=1 Tax=Haematobia irritans TaxID=7368 RepID=UPI003F509D45